MKGRDFLSIDDVTGQELRSLLDDAAAVKKSPTTRASALANRQIALIFEKPSTRTRVSFEAAVETMGGHAIVLRGDELQLGRGETIEDTGMVLSRYVDCIVIRTFGQDRLERLAEGASIPVINALSDLEHPCQTLADLQTILEHFDEFGGRVLTYVGDGNNVAHSLMLGGAKLGMEVRVACPPGHAPTEEITTRSSDIAASTNGRIIVTHDPVEAVSGADVLYTDVWTSMGQEAEMEARRKTFEPFSIDQRLVELASPEAIVMHCLPAHRGEEIAADVIDGPRSVVFDQAENRMHAQKALLAQILP